jgi:energy-coupling factor transporter ATP-binding protein EcfA2
VAGAHRGTFQDGKSPAGTHCGSGAGPNGYRRIAGVQPFGLTPERAGVLIFDGGMAPSDAEREAERLLRLAHTRAFVGRAALMQHDSEPDEHATGAAVASSPDRRPARTGRRRGAGPPRRECAQQGVGQFRERTDGIGLSINLQRGKKPSPHVWFHACPGNAMTQPKSIHDELLEFSAKQPLWVQDALRRIVSSGTATQADLDDAVAMCKAAHGLATVGVAPTPVPLASTHLPASGASGGAAVTLTALHNLENVNALLGGQTLTISPSGITIVYGTNGAGKSGYARVLKRLCRARGNVAPILPNVFAKSSGRPRASIAFSVGSTPQVWTGEVDALGPPPPDTLGGVSVYDGAAGAHTVAEKQEVTLLPPGLYLLPELNRVLDHVAAVLKKEDAADTAAFLPSTTPGTKSSAFMQKLSRKTTKAEFDAACCWTADDESARVLAAAKVAELSANDPKALARKARKSAERIEKLVEALEKAAKGLGADVAARVDQRLDELCDAANAVAVHQGDLLPDGVLAGTGGGTWKVMWEAARAYSQESAYAGHEFPHVAEGARCVLCQQELGEPAVERLQAFEEYVTDALSKKLKAAQIAIEKAVEHVAQAIDPGLLAGTLLDVVDDLDGVDGEAVRAFVLTATATLDALQTRLDPNKEDVPVPQLGESPTAELKAAASAAREQADKLEATDAAEAMKSATSTMHVLEDRKVLHGARALIEAEVARQARVELRKSALRDCRTNQVSILLGSLTETHVTGALASAFNQELALLGGNHLAVEVVKTGTSKATTYTALALKNAVHDQAVVRSVFSEGEQRAISLAWFFAELTLSATKSAIVFDDPVSSLDHDWRRKVATRLVKEAAQRQVVVFTHDAVFLHILHTAADEGGLSPSSLQIQRAGGVPGYCSPDVPWEKMKVKERVGILTNEHVALTKTKKTGSDEEYAQAVVAYLDRLRKTWERAVEECLFNGVIERFGYGVKTQSIAEVDVLSTDYDSIDTGMSACSAWVHDTAQGLGDPPPTPAEIAAMVNSLVVWVNAIRDRRPKNSLPKLKPVPINAV